ncbi:MAG TPA: formate dehydrogenase accessory protein FdhE [Candidatus Dormibacteraeota bacterium]|nr:formate dehydrogenase accessory protein FdhE [Candidatus Dormibacteraeota bacterium]
MAVALAATDLWAERRRRVGELRARQGFARQLLDFYGALLGVQERSFNAARDAQPAIESLVAYVAETAFAPVVDVSVAVGPDRLRSDVIRTVRERDACDIVGAWMRNDDQPMVERFLARASLGPVLEALGAEARAACDGPRDAQHCPDCGGPAQLSFSAASSEGLATGRRFLVCARCAATWGFARMTCAGCGEDSSAKLNIFSERGTTSGERGSVVRGLPGSRPAVEDNPVFPHMRIDACDSCRRYLLSVDLATDPAAVPLVDELAAIPLDLFARERGYTKIIPNLMGF